MFAVVTHVKIDDPEGSVERLRNETVPQIRQAPGFARGVWLRHADASRGMGVVMFESREGAEAAAEQVRSGGAVAGVTVNRVEVLEVMAEA